MKKIFLLLIIIQTIYSLPSNAQDSGFSGVKYKKKEGNDLLPSVASQDHAYSGIQYKKDGTSITLSFNLPEHTRNITFEIRSDRNRKVSKLSDVSIHDPDPSISRIVEGKEMWFPVIDLQLTAHTCGIAVFDNVQAGDCYMLNSNFWPGCNDLREKIVLNNHLEHWENHLYVESTNARLSEFYISETIPVADVIKEGDIYHYAVNALTSDWSGEISIFGNIPHEEILIGKVVIPENREKRDMTHYKELTRDNVINALKGTIRYILSCQNKNPFSPTYGGLYLFYDLDAGTYRRADWIWTYGPAMRLLLEASKIPELAREFGYENLFTAAREIGEASLRFQMLDKDHPAYGLVICRYDPKLFYPDGFTGFLSPADSHFLAGYGWIPLYEATGDRRFLDAAILLTEQTGRILSYDDLIEQDYILQAGKWKNWTMNESGFGMEGLAEVYKITKDEQHKAIGEKYIKGLIDILESPDGTWYLTYHRNQADRADDTWTVNAPRGNAVLIKERKRSRGNGWAMIGLLASHRLMPENDIYLEKAKRLAERIMACQLENGAFPFYLTQSPDENMISEKGTTLWSMLFYQLHHFTQDPRHLDAALRALQWSLSNRYSGSDPQAHGGIIGITRASGVVYRNWFPLICTYTMDWFGLALLEELETMEGNGISP